MATDNYWCGGLGVLRSLVTVLLWSDFWKLQAQKVGAWLFSVEGMNFDFVAMNLTGFVFYSLYNTYGYFIKSDQTGQVDLNDVIFAYHALFATLVCIAQIAIYPSGKNRIHAPTIALLLLMWTFVLVYSTLTIVGFSLISANPDYSSRTPAGSFQLHGILQALHIHTEVPSSNVLELSKKVNQGMVNLQHSDGFNRRFTFLFANASIVPLRGEGRSEYRQDSSRYSCRHLWYNLHNPALLLVSWR